MSTISQIKLEEKEEKNVEKLISLWNEKNHKNSSEGEVGYFWYTDFELERF